MYTKENWGLYPRRTKRKSLVQPDRPEQEDKMHQHVTLSFRKRKRKKMNNKMMATVATKKKKGKGRPISSSVLSRPALEDSSSRDTLSAFSPSGDLFAFVSHAVDKHRLRVHDKIGRAHV